jgi:RNA polymerase sigma factor (sigma-70 family)
MQGGGGQWPAAEVLTRLVSAARNGNAAAVDELLTVLRPPLVSFFRRRLHDDASDDLTQLALIRICGALDRIDPERADAYITTVARNLLRTAYHARARDHARDGDTELADLAASAMSPQQRAEYEDLARAVHQACLTKLRPGLREVALGLLHGATAADIAEDLRVSPITVRTRLMRVRAILRTELAPYIDDAADVHHSSG